MENDESFRNELNAIANRLDAIKGAVKGTMPQDSCEAHGLGLLIDDLATRLRDLIEFGAAPRTGQALTEAQHEAQ